MNGAASTAFLARLEPRDIAGQPLRLEQQRRAAWHWLAEQGFPTAKDEAWKYTRIAPILETPFQPAGPGSRRHLTAARLAALAGDYGGPRLVFVNGYFAAELSSLEQLPAGIRVDPLAALALDERQRLEPLFATALDAPAQAFAALNSALAEDGALVQIAAHARVERPLQLLFLSDPGATPKAAHPRLRVLAGADSRASLVESHLGVGAERYLSNAVTQIRLEAGAELEHYKLQNERRTAFHVALLDVRQAEDSRFVAHSLALGGLLARQEVRVRLEGPGATVSLNGLYLPRGLQHLNNQTCIEHRAPRCTSRELYKGLIEGRGHGVFDGRIIVRPGALKSDARQTNKVLLLSATAQSNSQPRLEIFADDVQCAHGAAVGQLDEQAIFYLRSRGLPHAQARALLCYAFVDELLAAIPLEPLRARLQRLVRARLRSRELTP
ncbi:iron-regulated ABC transporter permease protein SufD [Pseudomonas sp. SJZ079]|uniref:Fe-S cluster assembly protein SufD n=1 Tax=Pseudomonas sp. SJZ079 TaxID=2572887 RepID=UPI00119C68D7|nr:Fe-S cluster assembly protein SufD [Pseudomonas sp. SJZ079]TWC38588.1 iron-regulated ABC transporter permease protein SufD [Pseudomonas sp. SJZ079]